MHECILMYIIVLAYFVVPRVHLKKISSTDDNNRKIYKNVFTT